MKITKLDENWIKGTEDFDEERELTFRAKVYEEGSEFGINGGKISKLEIRLGNEILCNYERGWGVRPSEEVRPFYKQILAQFN